MIKWVDVEALDLKPGDQVRYRFGGTVNSGGREDIVVRLGDVTVKMKSGNSVCMKACFQRRQETLPQGDDVKKTKTLCHVWNAGNGNHLGIYSPNDSMTQDARFISQLFEVEVPECPKPLTDAEKLEKLLAMGSLCMQQRHDTTSLTTYFQSMDDFAALIKEYSK